MHFLIRMPSRSESPAEKYSSDCVQCVFFENIVSVFQPHGDGALTSPPTPLTPTNYILTISYSFPFLHLAHYS